VRARRLRRSSAISAPVSNVIPSLTRPQVALRLRVRASRSSASSDVSGAEQPGELGSEVLVAVKAAIMHERLGFCV
jgi:hypothetical protein